MRSFLPVLAVVTAAGCASYKPRPDSLEQGVPLSERFTTEVVPSDYATPAPTENRFFSVDKAALKADIRAAIAARGIAPSPLHQKVLGTLSDGVAEAIDEASTGRAHLYSFYSPEEQEQAGAKRFCASVGPPHSMDRMEYAQRLTGISQLRLKPHFPGAEAIHETLRQHERNHCETYERFIPKWARESVADVAAVAHHYQEHGDDGFGEALGHIRNLESLGTKTTSHYTTPAINAALPHLRSMRKKELAGMSEDDIRNFALSTVVNKNRGSPPVVPNSSLRQDVEKRMMLNNLIRGKLDFSNEGLPLNLEQDNQMGEAEVEAIELYNTSLEDLFRTEDRALPPAQRRALMADHYRESLTDLTHALADPDLAQQALAYKKWQLEREKRELINEHGEDTAQLNYGPLPVNTRLDVVDAHLKEITPPDTSAEKQKPTPEVAPERSFDRT